MRELGGKRRPPRATATTWPPRNLAQASGASKGNDLWQVWLARVQAWRRAEAGAGRLMPWIPIAFGTGIALYFAAEREPMAWVALVTAVALSALAFMSRRSRVFVAMVSLASIASGFAAATIKASRVAHDVLTRPIYTSSIKGFVETREERERTDRFVLRVTQMDTARGQAALARVRLSVKKAFVMTAVVLVAIMVDRRAITFRTLAIAAMIVLLLTPEALVHPSFQMSFAATLGLVALVQIGMPKVFATPESSRTARAALWGGREIAMLALASLVAGLATTPYAAFRRRCGRAAR